MKKTILLVTTCLLSLISSASIIYTGDTLFEKKQYTEALTHYQKSLAENEYSEQMLLKMAFIAEGLEKPAEALYYLSLAQQNAPSVEILNQIETLANNNGLEGYTQSDQQLLYTIQHQYNREIKWGLVALVALLAGVLLWKKQKENEVDNGLLTAIVVFAIFTAVFNNYNWQKPLGVINQQKTYLLSGASPASTPLLHIPYGCKIEIVDQEDIWYKVRYNKQEGFVKKTKLLTLL